MREKLKLELYIEEHPDWEESLQKAPYFLKIKRDGEYVLFKYDQLNSDFSFSIVKEARGCIFHDDGEHLELVCLPYTKFFNVGESEAAPIDWTSAVVLEKIDGSLMKLWYHRGKWHLSTSGTIDAGKAMVGDSERSFKDVFEKAAGYPVETFARYHGLEKNYVYMFELVSPETRVVISYEKPELYFLSARNMDTLQETFFSSVSVNRPRMYMLNDLDSVRAIVEQMDKDHEGVVVSDKYFNRIKVKSPEYLKAAYAANLRGALTTKRLVDLYKNESLDDLASCGDTVKQEIEKFYQELREMKEEMRKEEERSDIFSFPSPSLAYACASKTPYPDYLIGRYRGKWSSPEEYIEKLRGSALTKMLERRKRDEE